jgi:uncharacterized iron-regulated membrane protein
MRANILRSYKTLHSWVGILSALFLFIAFYAGAITMLKAPLSAWLSGAPTEIGTPAEKADALIATVLREHPAAAKTFTLEITPADAHRVTLHWQEGKGQAWQASLSDTNTLMTQPDVRSPVPELIDSLHRAIGLPGPNTWTDYAMGIICALYALALFSGIILVIPSFVRDFFALRIGKNLKRMWLDMHNVLGIFSLPFHIAIAVTSFGFAFHDEIYSTQNLAIYDGQLTHVMQASNPFRPLHPGKAAAPLQPMDTLLAQTRSLNPAFEVKSLQYRAAGTVSATVRINGEDPRYMLRGQGFLTVSAATGEVISTDYFPGAHDVWNIPVSTLFALHFGSFGGEPIRWAYVLLGLTGSFIFYSGSLLWIESRRKKRAAESGQPALQTRSTRILGGLTVGVCGGCVAGISLLVALARALPAPQTGAQAAWSYYAVFLLCVLWSHWRGASRAMLDMAWLCAASYLLIPLVDLCQSLLGNGSGHGWYFIDLPALVGAAFMLFIARQCRHRAVNGPAESIWAQGITRPVQASI